MRKSSKSRAEAVAIRDEMLIEAAEEVFAGADGHQRSRSVAAVEQPLIGRAALLGLVPCGEKPLVCRIGERGRSTNRAGLAADPRADEEANRIALAMQRAQYDLADSAIAQLQVIQTARGGSRLDAVQGGEVRLAEPPAGTNPNYPRSRSEPQHACGPHRNAVD
jgi:hypothetical protein